MAFLIDSPDYFAILDHLNEVARKTGSTQKAQLDWTGSRAVLEMPESWYWMDVGRGPGKPPPYDVIYAWVLDRRMASGSDAVRIAWAVATNIGKMGVKGKNWLDQAIEEAADIFLIVIALKAEKDINTRWMTRLKTK